MNFNISTERGVKWMLIVISTGSVCIFFTSFLWLLLNSLHLWVFCGLYHYTFVVQRKPDGEEEDPENKKQKQESEGGSGDGPGPVQNGHAEVSLLAGAVVLESLLAGEVQCSHELIDK